MSQIVKILDPIKLAKQNARIQGQLLLRDLPRLEEMAHQENNSATIELQFGQNDSRLYFIQGKIKTVVNLICQRCDCPMEYNMDISFLLSPVISEERAKSLPKDIDPVFMENEVIDVQTMIEDEILLALPMISKHEQCPQG